VKGLDIAAGLTALVRLSEEGVPVFDTAVEGAEVYEIKVVRLVRPFLSYVVYLEKDIWWYPGWLDRRKVYAPYLSVGVGISEISGYPVSIASREGGIEIGTCIHSPLMPRRSQYRSIGCSNHGNLLVRSPYQHRGRSGRFLGWGRGTTCHQVITSLRGVCRPYKYSAWVRWRQVWWSQNLRILCIQVLLLIIWLPTRHQQLSRHG